MDVLADEDEDVEEGEENGHGQVREDHANVEVRFGGGAAVAEDVERPRERRIEAERGLRGRRLRRQVEQLGLREEEGGEGQAQHGYDAVHREALPGDENIRSCTPLFVLPMTSAPALGLMQE